jgi:SAM-dependent methyltransferase
MMKESGACRTKDASKMYTDGTYFDNNKTWHVEDSPWKAKQIQAIIEKNNIPITSICEVGCGAGEILKQLSQTIPRVCFTGYELSPQAFELCQSREDEKVKFYLKNILDENVFFDLLLCIDVFEHVEDYFGFLKSLKQKSKYKIFHIPLDLSVISILRGSLLLDRKSLGHLHYFTRETALETLKDCGYQVVDSLYTKSFIEIPVNTWKGKVAKPIYQIMFFLAPHFTVRLLGLSSLIVLAK